MARVCVFVMFLLCSALSGANELPRGEIISNVVCEKDPDHSYTLYLPSNYSEDRKWPVIYTFAPSGRGGVPVGLLHEAAERYGYIVVGSNNSRNGPWEVVHRAQKAMWREVNARYSVDRRRSYAGGFSGGSRASIDFVLDHQSRFAGLIQCGAMFPQEGGEYPKRADFAVFAVAGDADINLEEHLRAEALLAKRKYTQWLEVFIGGHQWPDAGLMGEAVEFLEVAAMRAGLRPEDRALVERIAASRLQSATDLHAQGWPLLATRKLDQVVSYFSETEAARKAKVMADEIRSVPGFADLEKREEAFIDDLGGLNDWYNPERFNRAVTNMKNRLGDDSREAERAHLTIHMVSFFLEMFGTDLLTKGDVEGGRAFLRSAAMVYPQNVTAAYNAACAFALTDQPGESLRFLQMAADGCFNNLDLIDTDRDLASLREWKEFAEVRQAVAANVERGCSPVRYDFSPRRLEAPN